MGMEKVEESPVMSPQQRADLDYAIRLAMTGRRDAEFEDRIRAQSDRITAEIREEHGLLDIAVALVREARDDR